jgi:hypothetical protein
VTEDERVQQREDLVDRCKEERKQYELPITPEIPS